MSDRNRSKAIIWQYFTRTTYFSSVYGVCDLCGNKLIILTGSTSSMQRHLKLHPTQYQEWQKLEAEKKSKVTPKKTVASGNISDFFKAKNRVLPKTKIDALDRRIGLMVALDLQPFSLVENIRFRSFANEAEPDYQIPTRRKVAKEIVPKLYDETKDKVQKELDCLAKHQDPTVCLTTDIWTSRAKDAYISLTINYLSDNFDPKSFTLEVRYFPGTHTAEHIDDAVSDMFTEWSLDGLTSVKCYVVSDNAHNMVSAFRHGEVKHKGCFCHSMDLAIGDGKRDCPGIEVTLKKARSVIGHFNHSPQALQKLHEAQERLGKPIHSLVQMVDIRWNSEYLSLKRLVEQREPVTLCLSTAKIDNLLNSEWEMIEGLVELLEPFYDATVEMSEGNYPTLSKVIPLVSDLNGFLDDFIRNSKKGTTFARALRKAMKSRFPDNNDEDCHLAMILNPCFKDKCLDATRKKLYTEKLKTLCRRIQRQKAQADTAGTPQPSGSSESSEAPKKRRLYTHYRQQCDKNSVDMGIADDLTADLEVENYLTEDTIPIEEDPLAWWQKNRNRFKLLAQLALKYECLLSSSVTSERVFSTGSNVVTNKRTKLKPENVSMIVFIHDNFLKVTSP